ncbi:alpha/beta hydrolase fold domain-containing protein [Streptomyces tricolor]|nr:alpha/beta hydrolase fold domain-containing protein [Streptomyces tricolor]
MALPGNGGTRIRVRVLRPAGSDDALPVVLYLHGLGWMLTDAYAYRHLVTQDQFRPGEPTPPWSSRSMTPRRRPPSPAPSERAYTRGPCGSPGTARNAGRMGAGWPVVGASAGAQQAAALHPPGTAARRPGPGHQVPPCPVTDAAMDNPSYRQFADGYFLTRAAMRAYWQQYAPDPLTRAHDTVSPLRAPSPASGGLPPTLVLTAEADVLRDEGEAYAARPREADVPVVSSATTGRSTGSSCSTRRAARTRPGRHASR